MSAAHIHCVHIQFSNQFFLSFVWKGLEFTLPAALAYDKETGMPNGLQHHPVSNHAQPAADRQILPTIRLKADGHALH